MIKQLVVLMSYEDSYDEEIGTVLGTNENNNNYYKIVIVQH